MKHHFFVPQTIYTLEIYRNCTESTIPKSIKSARSTFVIIVCERVVSPPEGSIIQSLKPVNYLFTQDGLSEGGFSCKTCCMTCFMQPVCHATIQLTFRQTCHLQQICVVQHVFRVCTCVMQYVTMQTNLKVHSLVSTKFHISISWLISVYFHRHVVAPHLHCQKTSQKE